MCDLWPTRRVASLGLLLATWLLSLVLLLPHRCVHALGLPSSTRISTTTRTKQTTAATTTTTTIQRHFRRPHNHEQPHSNEAVHANRLLHTILDRYHNTNHTWGEEEGRRRPTQPLHSNWTKLRNYLYRSGHALSVGQVEQVCDFLEQTLLVDPDTPRIVLQTTPRILRKTVPTNLAPTAHFLRDLYGDTVFAHAVRRNPSLLLTRGSGYNNVDTLDLVSVYLRQDLSLTEAALRKIRTSAPQVFQTPLSTLLPTVSYLQGLLGAAINRTDDNSKDEVRIALVKLITHHPTLLQLSVNNVAERVNYLVETLQLNNLELAELIRRHPSILSQSVEHNLKPTIRWLGRLLEPSEIGTCVRKHPSIVGLSLRNLQAKRDLWDSVDQYTATTKPSRDDESSPDDDSLASRILQRCPAVYSLSIESLQAKVEFLSGVWGVAGTSKDHDNDDDDSTSRTTVAGTAAPTLRDFLSEDPSVLTLSLERNLRPTVGFLNRTGYIQVDDHYRLVSGQSPVRPRVLAASLSGRLVPRWLFATTSRRRRSDITDGAAAVTDESPPLPLYVLAAGTDDAFCRHCHCKLDEYRAFQRASRSRWTNWTSPGDVWLGTGLALAEATSYATATIPNDAVQY